jgi:hypothetical protein
MTRNGVLLYLELEVPEGTPWSEVADCAAGLLGCEATPRFKMDPGSIRAYEALSDVEEDVRSGQIDVQKAPPMMPVDFEFLGYMESDPVRVVCPSCGKGSGLLKMSTYIGEAHVDSFVLWDGKLRADNCPNGTTIEWDGSEPWHGHEWKCFECQDPFRHPRVLPKVPVEAPEPCYENWLRDNEVQVYTLDKLYEQATRKEEFPNALGFLRRVPGSKYFRSPPDRRAVGIGKMEDVPDFLELQHWINALRSRCGA